MVYVCDGTKYNKASVTSTYVERDYWQQSACSRFLERHVLGLHHENS